MKMTTANIKAIGMLSGGLDSLLAAKVVKDCGIDVTMLHFILPWKDTFDCRLPQWCTQIGVKFMALPLDDTYMDIVKCPANGYGSAMNPCIDCKIHMLQRAKKYLEEINGHFVFTGEVLGQRPMSQNKNALNKIEKESGLAGYLLRPLSAQLLAPTIPEINNLIDREKLLSFSGRSRHNQLELIKKFNINNFSQPAGGCLLTENSFGNRLKDSFKHNYQNYHDTKILAVGRHFRINPNCKIIAGRDEQENERLLKLSGDKDILLQMQNTPGPLVILQDNLTPNENLTLAAGILQHYTKLKDYPPQQVHYWQKIKNEPEGNTILAAKISSLKLDELKI